MTCLDATWLLPAALAVTLAGFGGAAISVALAARSDAVVARFRVDQDAEIVRRAARLVATGRIDDANTLLTLSGINTDDRQP